MKKLLALLLAMVLPVCACAEAYVFTVGTTADAAIFPSAMTTILRGLGLSDDDLSRSVQALQAVLQNASLRVTLQEDASQVELSLSGSPLVDVTIHETEGATVMTSTFLPGYALVEAAPTALPNQLGETGLQQMAAGVTAAITQWLANLEAETTYGAFEGDAYQGGVQCTTWALTDQDVAALVSELMTEEARAFLMQLLNTTAASDLLRRFDETNARVAEEDRYMYILRAVRDRADKLIGLSLTVMGEVEQLATVSVGVGEKQLRLVVGMGLSEQNYWGEYVLQANQREQLTFLKGTCREWMADKFSTFAYVRETAAPVAASNWSCNVSRAGSRYLWDGSLCTGETPDAANALCSFNGSVNTATHALDASIKLLPGLGVPLKLNISYKPAESLPPLDPSLTQVHADDPSQAETCLQLIESFYQAVTTRLVQLLPLDVILTFGEWFQ